MAARKRTNEEKPKYQCRNCKNSYNWHEKNWEGNFFMCYCKHYKEGKFSKFLSDPQCGHFIPLEDMNDGENK